MKKIIFCILTVALVACGNNNDIDTQENKQQDSADISSTDSAFEAMEREMAADTTVNQDTTLVD